MEYPPFVPYSPPAFPDPNSPVYTQDKGEISSPGVKAAPQAVSYDGSPIFVSSNSATLNSASITLAVNNCSWPAYFVEYYHNPLGQLLHSPQVPIEDQMDPLLCQDPSTEGVNRNIWFGSPHSVHSACLAPPRLPGQIPFTVQAEESPAASLGAPNVGPGGRGSPEIPVFPPRLASISDFLGFQMLGCTVLPPQISLYQLKSCLSKLFSTSTTSMVRSLTIWIQPSSMSLVKLWMSWESTVTMHMSSKCLIYSFFLLKSWPFQFPMP